MSRTSAYVVVAGLLVSPPGFAAEKAEHVVALFLIARENPKAQVSATIAEELTRLAGAGIKVVSGSALKKILKRPPEMAITLCGSDIPCIAKLGRTALADMVLYGRVSPEDAGFKVQFLAVDVDSETVQQKTFVYIGALETIASALASKRGELFGGAPAQPAPQELPSASKEERVPELTAAPPGDAATTSSARPTPSLGEPSPAGGASAGATWPWWQHRNLFFYSGLGAAGVGVVLTGVGGVLGMQAKSHAGNIDPSTDQLTTIELTADANREATRANRFFIAGGGAVLVGAALLAWQFLASGTEQSAVASLGSGTMGFQIAW